MPKTFAWPAENPLRRLPASAIVDAIADAAGRWRDADFPPRVRVTAALERRTGYSTPVVEVALDRLFTMLEREALAAAIAGELGSLAALDGLVPRPNRPAAQACGLERIAICASQATIGVALLPAAFALCAKANVAVKDRDDALVGAFFETLAAERTEFATATFAAAWTGGAAGPLEAELLGRADAVVAFGHDASLRAIRAQLRGDARFIAYGPRSSLGYVARDALCDEPTALRWAAAAAADALLYDGEGCLSAHALFVETGGAVEPPVFARWLSAAFARAAIEFPAGTPPPERAAEALAVQRLAVFRAAHGRGVVFPAGAAAVILAPPRDEPPPFAARTLPVFAVEGPAELADYVGRHALPVEAIGIAGELRADLLAACLRAGAVRLCRLGELQRPSARADHGGLGRITPFVRWVDAEL